MRFTAMVLMLVLSGCPDEVTRPRQQPHQAELRRHEALTRCKIKCVRAAQARGAKKMDQPAATCYQACICKHGGVDGVNDRSFNDTTIVCPGDRLP